MEINILLWINVLLSVVMMLVISYYIYQISVFNRRETYAVIVNSEGIFKKNKRVDSSRSLFRYGGGAYNIDVERSIPFGKKRLLIYREGSADPLSVRSDVDSRIDARTYHNILDNEVIRALNKPTSVLSMDTKKWVLIGAGILLFFIASSQGWI